ncbi:MAG: outer membrane beta-barrel protein [Spirochaetes bacterium]|nr:outer membrane beta-barrel protein [Spirochaetota bacterium]
MKRLFIASLMVFLMTAAVFAQDAQRPITAGKVGLSFFTAERITDLFLSEGNLRANFVESTGISLIYHVTDSFALEPSVFFSYRDYTRKSNDVTDDYMTAGGALGIFYYSNLSGGAYMYIGPRVDYLRMEETDNNSDGSYDETNIDSYGVSLVLGLKYMFNAHVGIFGDISAGYFFMNQERTYYDPSGTPGTPDERESNNFILSKGLVGVTLYF